jgi:ATP-dependent helicase/nuclease subunit B
MLPDGNIQKAHSICTKGDGMFPSTSIYYANGENMSLQFIIGNSGAGKSRFSYQTLIEASIQNPSVTYYVIVPEQFTMQTQKTLVEMHPGKGILNIDVLSFERLAYRVFEEVGGDSRKLLEETGKSMVLQKIVQSE